MTKGIIISKEGFNVQSESEHQYVDTKKPLFKLFKSDSGQQVFAATDLTFGGKTFLIPHNLGYIPMVFLFCDRADSSIRKMVFSLDTSYPENQILALMTVDKTNINLTMSGGSSVTGTFGYTYYIFYDKVGHG